MDNSIDVICTFDVAGRFLQVNRACERLWGYLPEEPLNKSEILALLERISAGRNRAVAAALPAV
jgi:PAS domain S-box-containing protein